jgi:hypothetical protein
VCAHADAPAVLRRGGVIEQGSIFTLLEQLIEARNAAAPNQRSLHTHIIV